MFKYTIVDYISSILVQPFLHIYLTVTSLLFMPIHWLDIILDTQIFTELIRFYSTRLLVHCLRVLGRRVSFKGAMDVSTPCIIAVKHEHSLDTAFMGSHKSTRLVTFVIKKELFWIPFLKDCIPVNRNGRDLHFFNRVKEEIIVRKRSILIFPEGTRVIPGEIKPYSNSIALIARRLNVRVLPISTNVGTVLNTKKRRLLRIQKYGHAILYKEQETLTYKGVIFNHYYELAKEMSLDEIDWMKTSEIIEMLDYVILANRQNHIAWHNSGGYSYFKLLRNKLECLEGLVASIDLQLSNITEFITFDLPDQYQNTVQTKFTDEIKYCAQVLSVIKMQHVRVTDEIFTDKLAKTIENGCQELRKLV